MIGLITRSIFWDLVKVASLSLAAVTALLTIGGAMLEASRQGLDPVAVLVLLPLLVPPTLPYTIPTCMLFACTFVYGRMSTNQEVVALKAGGVNAGRIFLPAATLALGICGAGLLLTDRCIPWCNQQFTAILLSDIQSAISAYIKQNGEIVMPDFPYEIYVQDVFGDRLIRPVFKHRTGAGAQHDMVAMADEATLHVQHAESGKLEDAVLVLSLIDGVVCSTRQDGAVRFNRKAFEMPMPPIAHMRDDKLESSNNAQCLVRSKRKSEEVAKVHLEYGGAMADAVLGGAPEVPLTDAPGYRDAAIRLQRKSREAVAEVHMRVAQSAIALPFVLLGCPIGVLFQRRDFLQTFFSCFLPIITVYYPMLILAFNVYKEGVCPSPIVLWVPCIGALFLSVPFIRRVIRY